MKNPVRILLPGFSMPVILLTALLIAACNDKTSSPEDEIRQFIDSGIDAAEQRNTGDLSDMIQQSYSDQKGYDKKQLISLMRIYFLRNKSIYLFSKIKDIQISGNQNAKVELYVAMAGKQISDITLLSNYRARIYYFELQLIKPDDEWLLEQASWKPASAADIQ
jgi:hypothetical protein